MPNGYPGYAGAHTVKPGRASERDLENVVGGQRDLGHTHTRRSCRPLDKQADLVLVARGGADVHFVVYREQAPQGPARRIPGDRRGTLWLRAQIPRRADGRGGTEVDALYALPLCLPAGTQLH